MNESYVAPETPNVLAPSTSSTRTPSNPSNVGPRPRAAVLDRTTPRYSRSRQTASMNERSPARIVLTTVHAMSDARQLPDHVVENRRHWDARRHVGGRR